uniref:Uncharacterized protein n=1 Tax=Manihot esculenta TaxID=3983 RepID=A0A199UBM2_MANES
MDQLQKVIIKILNSASPGKIYGYGYGPAAKILVRSFE